MTSDHSMGKEGECEAVKGGNCLEDKHFSEWVRSKPGTPPQGVLVGETCPWKRLHWLSGLVQGPNPSLWPPYLPESLRLGPLTSHYSLKFSGPSLVHRLKSEPEGMGTCGPRNSLSQQDLHEVVRESWRPARSSMMAWGGGVSRRWEHCGWHRPLVRAMPLQDRRCRPMKPFIFSSVSFWDLSPNDPYYIFL